MGKNIIMAGMTEGYNFPKDTIIDIREWKETVIVDRKYLLEHTNEILDAARNMTE